MPEGSGEGKRSSREALHETHRRREVVLEKVIWVGRRVFEEASGGELDPGRNSARRMRFGVLVVVPRYSVVAGVVKLSVVGIARIPVARPVGLNRESARKTVAVAVVGLRLDTPRSAGVQVARKAQVQMIAQGPVVSESSEPEAPFAAVGEVG